jgi:uncharacterized protein
MTSENSDSLNLIEPHQVMELKKLGYLKNESVVEKIEHPYTRNIDVFLDRKIEKITLQLTQNCNLRCKYCVYSNSKTSRQRSHTRKKMSLETAKKSIDFLWNHSVDSRRVNVGFYGGEPLLEFEMMQKIVEYSKRQFIGKELSFSITTNGTLLNDEIIHYFEDFDIPIIISLDGIKEVHNKNRIFSNGKGTYDAIITNIQRIKQIAPKLAKNMQVNMVINPENDYDCFNLVCLEGKELDKLVISASIVDYDYEDKLTTYSEDYITKSEYQNFLALLERMNRVNAKNVSPLSINSMSSIWDKCEKMQLITGLCKTDTPSGPCIPGQFRLFVDVTGRFFPCERVSEKSRAMCIGNLEDGFDKCSINKQLNIGKLTEDLCKNCWCFRHCGLCVKKADDGTESLSAKRKLKFCDSVITDVHNIMSHYLFFKETQLFYQSQTRKQ